MTTTEVLEKYFKGERLLFFHSSDAHQLIEGDTYLTYRKEGVIQLWLGGNNGEVCLCCTNDGDKLEQVIKALTY